ncbi:MAG: beta-ketoacyl-[acyl-carrier-protein] synthase family protein [Burkholderiales bacterium]|nr:beta-ketoacyl-[acyl-carrier-protein] synthase family protein [Burkholderiales bacterium]MDE2160151.1 beta-ketoacyl-[acyl-carrier-protein] synthase family protein [Burkholderiales bacterium]MDE2501354.1 beta-ketoacyl-[acyl-carrier-protein] synthase family protein [Burkholderiales bacterium]
MRRVVVTGMGCVSPLGLTAAATWDAMREGRSGIAPLAGLEARDLRTAVAAQIKGYDALAHFDEKRLVLLDPVSQYALVAARQALAQAGLRIEGEAADRAAVIVGTGIGGATTQEQMARRLYLEGNPRVHPMAIVRVMPNAPASQISLEMGFRGPAFAVASACASANHAFAQALALLRSGGADVALAGGVEACITVGTVKAWEAMRVMADDTCRPFSIDRHGLVLGEGAGMFLLETLEHARARGAEILAELAGAGMSADAADIVMPDAGGAARAMRSALAQAGLAPQDIGYINAHGTGTPANDRTETQAIHAVFGAHARQLAVSSTKSMHGHGLGAGGAIELVAVIGALREGVIAPTINYLGPDPACDLDVVPNVARERPVQAALSNSFAFGGLNAVVALRRCDD